MWKALSNDVIAKMKSAKELHFRFLMTASEKALGALSKESTNNKVPNQSAYSAGLCLSSSRAYGSVRNSNGNTTRTLGFAIRKVGASSYKVSLLVLGDGDDHGADVVRTYDIMNYTGGTDLFCYAKVTVGAGTDGKDKIEAMAVPVSSYNPEITFSVATEAKLIGGDGTGAPNALNFALGSYTVQKGPVLFDEFALATSAKDILKLVEAGAPNLKDSALTRAPTGYSATSELTSAAAQVAVLADDGTNAPVRFDGGEIALGEDGKAAVVVPFTTATLAENTGYRISLVAENEVGAVTNVVGDIYTGAVSIAKTQDGNEDGPVNAQFTVSIPVASAYDHTIGYTLGNPDAAGVSFKPLSGSVTIPAGETSVVIEVEPLVNPVAEDQPVALILSMGAYEVSETASRAAASIVNLELPEGYTTWIAAAKGDASVEDSWSAGAPSATNPLMPRIDGRFSNAEINWNIEPWTEDGVLPAIAFRDYTGVFQFNTRTPTTVRQGEELFEVGKLAVGSSRSTKLVLDGGTYQVNGPVSIGNLGPANVSVTLTNATLRTTDQIISAGSSSGHEIHFAKGSVGVIPTLNFGSSNSSSGSSKFIVDEGADVTFGAMNIATCNNQIIVEGEVTNNGALSLSTRGNNSQNGSSLTIRKTGHFVQKGTCKVCCWYGASCNVLEGGRLDVTNGILIGCEGDSGKWGRLVVSNATVTAGSVSVCSDDRHEQQSLYLYADPGETSTITTTGGLEMSPEGTNCRNGKSNAVRVRGGHLNLGGAIRVGTPFTTEQGNVFDIARVNSKVTATGATFNNNSNLKFTLDAKPFDETPFQMTGPLTFNHTSKLVIDASKAKGGKYPLITASSITGLDDTEIELIPAKHQTTVFRTDTSIGVKVKTTCVIIVR